MPTKRARVEVTVSLSKSTCYFMKTGKCSLNLISHLSAPSARPAPSELLYCPKLYRSMLEKERGKPVTVALCQCGHGQVIAGHQRACIAGQKGLPIELRAVDEEVQPACDVCSGQITFDQNVGGQRIVSVKAVIKTDEN